VSTLVRVRAAACVWLCTGPTAPAAQEPAPTHARSSGGHGQQSSGVAVAGATSRHPKRKRSTGDDVGANKTAALDHRAQAVPMDVVQDDENDADGVVEEGYDTDDGQEDASLDDAIADETHFGRGSVPHQPAVAPSHAETTPGRVQSELLSCFRVLHVCFRFACARTRLPCLFEHVRLPAPQLSSHIVIHAGLNMPLLSPLTHLFLSACDIYLNVAEQAMPMI
jgi:hypothetical protein